MARREGVSRYSRQPIPFSAVLLHGFLFDHLGIFMDEHAYSVAHIRANAIYVRFSITPPLLRGDSIIADIRNAHLSTMKSHYFEFISTNQVSVLVSVLVNYVSCRFSPGTSEIINFRGNRRGISYSFCTVK